MITCKRLAAVSALLLSAAAPAWSAISFNATGSGGRNATATFDLVAGQLKVTLTNNATAGSGSSGGWVPIDILSGLFFNVTSGPAGILAVDAHSPSRVSQFTTGGTETVIYAAGSPGRDIGSQWAERTGPISDGSTTVAGVNVGVASAGLGGAFGSGDVIGNDADGADIEGIGGTPPDGLAYSIIGGAATTYANNGGVAGRSLVKGTAAFLFDVPVGFTLSEINYVVFNYGTALGEGGFICSNDCVPPSTTTGVPEPGSLALAGLALIAGATLRRRLAVRR